MVDPTRPLKGGPTPDCVDPDGGFVDPTAVVDAGAVIGERTRVWHFSHVMSGAIIGSDCMLGQNTFVAGGVRVGNGVRIQNNVSVFEGVELEDGVFCGPSVVFTNDLNPRAEIRRQNPLKTIVRRGATLGANSTIMCGVTVGSYAFVGAGAVVTKDVPDHALVIGVPARIGGWRCRCGDGLDVVAETLLCRTCGQKYPRLYERARTHGSIIGALGLEGNVADLVDDERR